MVSPRPFKVTFLLVEPQAGAVFVATMLFMRESYAYVILQRKITGRLRKETGNPHLRSALDNGRDPKELFRFSILRPIKMLFLSPIVILMSLYMATIYGYLYLMVMTHQPYPHTSPQSKDHAL